MSGSFDWMSEFMEEEMSITMSKVKSDEEIEKLMTKEGPSSRAAKIFVNL
jgi:hypothetical protein